MRPLTIIVIVLALLVATAIFFLAPLVLQPQQTAEPVVIKQTAVRVLVADADLAAGTILDDGDFRWREWPEDGVGDNFVVEKDAPDGGEQFVGAVVRQSILAGEPMTEARVVRPDTAEFLSAALAPGMRAATIEIDAVTGAAGFVVPGDRIDILLTAVFELEVGGDESEPSTLRARTISETILANVRVLAIDQTVNDQESEPNVGKTITVELDPKQVEKLEVARQLGRLSLVLRSLSKPEEQISANSRFTRDVEVSSFLAERSVEGQRLQDATNRRQAEERAATLARDAKPSTRVLVAA